MIIMKTTKQLKEFANESIDPKWERLAREMNKKEKDYIRIYLKTKLERLT